MPRSLLRAALVSLLTLALAPAAHADGVADESVPERVVDASKLRALANARSALRTTAAGETTYVGYSPNFAGSNYWSIGTGNYRPGSSNPNDFGYWDWDHPVHGDSLQGWWPYRGVFNNSGGLNLSDDQRPWWALDTGNAVNYVINQGAGLKRTFGVVGIWHRDPGSNASDGVGWTPLSGSYSLWCGLRRANDNSVTDPITGNAFNGTLLMFSSNNFISGSSASGVTSHKWPGYGGSWDQLAYRDVDVSGASTITLRFKYRTNMSTGYGTNFPTRTGWFDKDPYSMAAGNFISSSAAGTATPIDSFMVYIGAGVRDSLGVALGSGDEYSVGSDGATRRVYDRQRRYFSEVLRVDRPYREVFTAYGDHPVTTQTTSTIPVDAGWNGRARVVIRNKTNRGFDDENGSQAGAYSSNGAGAVVIDDVEVDLGSGFTSLSDFETSGQVNNDLAVSPLDAWKTTGKPPAILGHVHDIASLQYDDLCGPVGGLMRICNLAGNVISIGDHDHGEAAGGAAGSPEYSRNDEIISPAVGLRNNGGTNSFGINAAIAAATGDILLDYDMYSGLSTVTNGAFWTTAVQCWPARQSDGQLVWGAWRTATSLGVLFTGPVRATSKECIHVSEPLKGQGALFWSAADAEGGSAYPDSIRFRLRKTQDCLRFGVTLGCSADDGLYFDNVSLAFITAPVETGPDLSASAIELINDTFTVNGLNRGGVAPGSAAFDTTAALIKCGRNIARNTNNLLRYDVPGDTATVVSETASRVDLVFRVSPGPGNYVTIGNRASGLRRVPTSSMAVDYLNATNDGNFWAEYLRDNGAEGTPGGHPAGGTNGGRDWSPLVWNSARCDTLEQNFWPIPFSNLGITFTASWATMYHESDPKFTKLGLAKNRCWARDPNTSNPDVTCDISQTLANWPVTAGYVAENGLPLGQTYEYTKILPDGQFTPGTHVEYFFRAESPAGVTLGPDTSMVYPQEFNGSLDGRRWEEFSVLPDAWKKIAYGGLGQASLLFVDWGDGRGSERAWVSIADSLGATRSTKWGAHNGWHAPGTGAAALNDPSSFVRNLNQQPGSTWDLYQVKGGGDSGDNVFGPAAGTLGADYANHTNLDGRWSFQGPSIGMLEAYYKVIMLSTGDVNFHILGPFNGRSSDDTRILREFMIDGTSSDHRGVWVTGDGFVQATEGSGTSQDDLLHNFFKVSLRDPSYLTVTGSGQPYIDLQVLSPISTAGNVYGVQNGCVVSPEVLTPGPGGVPASLYSPISAAVPPVVAGVFHDVNPGAGEFWQSLVDGFDLSMIGSRFFGNTVGRLAYSNDVLLDVFGKICSIVTGCPGQCLDVPNSPDPSALVDFMGLRNTPLRSGEATVEFGLAQADRVQVRLYDVSGRLVRILADRTFAAGKHTALWDGLDSAGQPVRRGVYFAQVRYLNRGFTDARKLIVLK